MDAEDDIAPQADVTSRVPTQADLVAVCRELNVQGALYLVVGGFAIIHAGYPRTTGDLDLLIATDLANERRVYLALEVLADKAVRELQPGETSQYLVVRVCDEIIVDLSPPPAASRMPRPARTSSRARWMGCAFRSLPPACSGA